MTGIDIFLTVGLLYFVTQWCGPCSEAVPAGAALEISGVPSSGDPCVSREGRKWWLLVYVSNCR